MKPTIFGIIVMVIAIFILTPFAVIWSLNTLFHTGVPTNLETWAAVAILCVVIGGSTYKSSS